MQTLKPYTPVSQASANVANYDGLLLRLGARDRAAVEKHVAACESEPTAVHVTLWKRLACLLCNLAPRAMQTAGQRAVQFFAADGKYRRQVFAMEDLRDGALSVYMVDVEKAALATGVLRGPIDADGGDVTLYPDAAAADGAGVAMTVTALTAANIMGAPDYYRHMVGWNRTVLKVTLPSATATAAQVEALEALCALAGSAATV